MHVYDNQCITIAWEIQIHMAHIHLEHLRINSYSCCCCSSITYICIRDVPVLSVYQEIQQISKETTYLETLPVHHLLVAWPKLEHTSLT